MYEYFDLGKLQAFAMEFVSGGTLLTVMSDGALPVDVALSLMKQMGRGLSALHRAGTHHRDLKPENVLVTADGLAKLTDFGIARVRGSGTQSDCEGMLEGTPKYVPPEYVESSDSDHRGDIYALGVITYEMIAGELPFRSLTNTSLLKERLQPHGLDLLNRIPELPAEIAAIIERCLSIQPIQRYPQAVDLVEAIEAVQRVYGLADIVEYEEVPQSTKIVWGDVLREFKAHEEKSQSLSDAGVEL
jgi:serine/threonine-protein kinase